MLWSFMDGIKAQNAHLMFCIATNPEGQKLV